MPELELELKGRVARLTLDRPNARNALSPSLLEALVERCAELSQKDEVRVVVLRGAGGTFSAGADLAGFMAQLAGPDAARAADLGRRAADAIMALPQITVAVIDGYCIGGGVVLAGACDLRWADADATFGIPELELGIPLAWGGLSRLCQLVGETRAVELVTSCRRFDAEEAMRIGFVSALAGPDIEERIDALADRPLGVLRTTKAQLHAIRAGTFEGATDAGALLAALNDPESQQAASAYFARRRAK